MAAFLFCIIYDVEDSRSYRASISGNGQILFSLENLTNRKVFNPKLPPLSYNHCSPISDVLEYVFEITFHSEVAELEGYEARFD